MLLAVLVLLNGAFVPSSPPVLAIGGHLMVPLGPVLTRMLDRVSREGDAIVLVRGAQLCVFRIAIPAFRCDASIRLGDAAPFARDGIAYLPLATVVRAFGGTMTYDATRRTAAVALPVPTDLGPPPPFDPEAPQATPTQVFTPQPAPATPQAVESGDPRPRRTAIPATPSRVPD
jgi:hypothetical protein